MSAGAAGHARRPLPAAMIHHLSMHKAAAVSERRLPRCDGAS